LREVARRLLLSVRSYDFVGRYGGEEFLVVLNNCRPDSAFGRGEQIRKIISTRPIQTDAGARNHRESGSASEYGLGTPSRG
jgi:two-component system, cell cycle response regulator